MADTNGATTLVQADAMPWRELATRTRHDRDIHQRRADDAWQRLDVIEAVRNRGIVEGLDIALANHACVVAETLRMTDPADIDCAAEVGDRG